MGSRIAPKTQVLVISLESEVLGIIQKCEELGLRCAGFDNPKDFLAGLKTQKPQASILFITENQKKVMTAMIQGIRNVLGQEPVLFAVIGKKEKNMSEELIKLGVNYVIQRPLSMSKLATVLSKVFKTKPIEKILETVSAQPKFKFKTPEIMDFFFQKFAPAMAGISSVLENIEDSEMRNQFYSERLAPYTVPFTGLVNSKRKSETKLDLMQSIRAYGTSQVRQLVVALKLSESTTGNLLNFNEKTGMLSAEPKNIIPFAVKLVEHYGEDTHMREVAFNNGLVYDLLSIISDHAGNKKSLIKKELGRFFEANIKKADEYFKKAASEKNLALVHHSLTYLMMRDAGKILMSIFYQDYIDVISWYEKKSIRTSLQHIAEYEKYQISSNLMGAMIAQATPGLTEAYPCVLFNQYPFMLKGSKSEKNIFDLVEFCVR